MDDKQDLMEKVISLAKRRGFFYPGSEIYGGLANTYDYGPVGTELLKNIRSLWWNTFVQRRDDIVGLDASIISSAKVWEASGHAAGFSDVMLDCKECKLRFRADHVIEEALEKKSDEEIEKIYNTFPVSPKINIENVKNAINNRKVEGLTVDELNALLNELNVQCPNCKKFSWTEPRKFNLLFPVKLGIVEGDQALAYLRGETAQSIFINFKNVVDSTRVKLPFGIAQLGKSFRNEITLGNSIFRTIEFEQGEIEYFFDPKKAEWEQIFDKWKNDMWQFVSAKLGIKTENIRWREHTDEERSFYSKKTVDLEYHFPFGFKELWGLAYRTDYDLKQHSKFSGKELSIIDPDTNERLIPHVIEPAVGINRLLLMILADSYSEENGRIVLKIKPTLAPYKVAIFPLLANKPELIEKAKNIYDSLIAYFMVAWDDRGNIGKRYAYQDEIGTPFCVTIDFQTLEDDTVTVRDRDTMKQDRIKIDQLNQSLESKINA